MLLPLVLHIACGKQSSEVVVQLLNAKAGVNKRNNSGQTPLHKACENESSEIVTQLIDAGALVNLTNTSGQTPLQIACKKGFTDITVELLNAGAKIWPRDGDKKGPDMTRLSLDGATASST